MSEQGETGRLVVDRAKSGAALLRELVEGARAGGFGEGLIETPVAELGAVVEQHAKLLDAIRYTLARAQVDADLGYYLGPCTEAWERLVAAESLAIGAAPGPHRAQRMRSLAPEHARRDPTHVELQRRIEELEGELAEARRG